MNKHTRFLVIFLVAVILILTAAIVVFHMSVNKETAGGSESVPYAVNRDDSETESVIFEDDNGLYGLRDENGTIILEAEWAELEPIGDSYFKARLVVRSDSLYGVIDSEGDVVVPFVYDEIEKQSDLIYTAKLAEDGRYYFYDPEFRLLISEAADDFTLEGTFVRIDIDGDEYVWRQGTELELIGINISRYSGPVSFTLNIDESSLLSYAEWWEWRDISEMLIAFLDAYRSGHPDELNAITDSSSQLQVESVFSEKLQWNGEKLTELYVYSLDNADGRTIYFETSIHLVSKDEDTAVTDKTIVNADDLYKLRLAFKENAEGKWKLYEALVLKQES